MIRRILAALATTAFAILYVISPIDVIPDFIPGIGWMDDLAVILMAISRIKQVFNPDDASTHPVART